MDDLSIERENSRANPIEVIESICEQFSNHWQDGAQSQIARHVADAEPSTQAALLRNLLQIDFERRRALGQQPRVDEYTLTLPGQEMLIAEELTESMSDLRSMASTMAQGNLDQDDTQRSAGAYTAPMIRRLGDYHLIRELGRGGMGVVFEAVHSQRQDHVALKTLPIVDGERLHLFKQEFRSLSNINHPNLAGLHTLESDGKQWFFTMDLIDGVSFRQFVRPDDKLDEQRLRQALVQLVTAVTALHKNQVVHRDLKPSNVMIDPHGRVVLLDFGLAQQLDENDPRAPGDRISGTPAYMAPEQARGAVVDPACDWYAVGVMLYQALSGTLPFVGKPLHVMKQKQVADPPPLSANELPADLCKLCMALLSRDASERPTSIHIARAVAADPELAKSSRPSTGHHLISRETQQAELAAAKSSFDQTGEPIIVFVGGRSGEGKSSLIDAFLRPLYRDPSYAVLQGRCYDRESMPFKALDTTVDAVCNYMQSLPQEDIKRYLPQDMFILARLFPVFQRLESIDLGTSDRIDTLDQRERRTRATFALRELLIRISRDKQLILVIDDLQWGDSDSAEILLQVLRSPPRPSHQNLCKYWAVGCLSPGRMRKMFLTDVASFTSSNGLTNVTACGSQVSRVLSAC